MDFKEDFEEYIKYARKRGKREYKYKLLDMKQDSKQEVKERQQNSQTPKKIGDSTRTYSKTPDPGPMSKQ